MKRAYLRRLQKSNKENNLISPRIKFVTSLILKNQINLKNEENFLEISKFIVELMR